MVRALNRARTDAPRDRVLVTSKLHEMDLVACGVIRLGRFDLGRDGLVVLLDNGSRVPWEAGCRAIELASTRATSRRDERTDFGPNCTLTKKFEHSLPVSGVLHAR